MALSNLASLRFFLPETILVGGIAALVVASFVVKRRGDLVAAALTVATCLGAGIATVLTADGAARGLFGGLLARDPFADFFKLLAVAATAIVALIAVRTRDAVDHERGGPDACELGALLVAAALGVALMAAATDLLLVYLSLELVSLSSYVLAGLAPRSRRSAEAALKYVVYGGVASGTMLFGMSILYGLSTATGFGDIRAALASAPALPLAVAVALILAGFGFKVAVVPFHSWCPDVYEGAPTAVAAFLSVASKAGGFALIVRFFSDGLPQTGTWTVVLFVVAAASMTVGNLAALAQLNLKRLLAYSSIAHAGYILTGVAAGAPAGHQAVLFYLGVHLFMSLAAFAAVAAVAERGGGETVADWAGLGYRMPLPALVMTLALVALTGLPPTAGFVAKYYLFAALIERGAASGGTLFYAMALLVVTNSVISLAYYARVIRAMYLERASRAAGPPPWHVHSAVLVILALPVLWWGIYWAPLREASEAALLLWSAGPS